MKNDLFEYSKLKKGIRIDKYIGAEKEVVIPETIDSKPVTSIGEDAFGYCKSITSIIISEGVTSIGETAFEYCTSLTSIVLPEGVKSIGEDAFDGCSSLTSIKIPEGVKSIEEGTFDDCNNLTSIELPSSMSNVGYEFCGFNLLNISVEEGNKKYHSKDNCLIETAKNQLIVGCANSIIPDYVTSIRDNAFNGCSSLASITIPEGVTSIGESAFEGCSSLNDITIPNSVTAIKESSFNGCSSLTNITIPNNVTNIDTGAFKYCSNLTNIIVEEGNKKYHSKDNCLIKTKTNTLVLGCKSSIIPNYVTSIGSSAFEGCSNLTSITIPNSVTNIDFDAFKCCANLTDIAVEEGNKKYHSKDNCLIETSTNTLVLGCQNSIIPNYVTSIGSNAFCECSNLTSITIPNSVTNIDTGAFEGCSNLANIVVEEGNKKYHSKDNCLIETSTNTLVLGCPNSIIPNYITKIDYAFAGCNSLINITIPESVTWIDAGAFYNCANLTDVTILGSETTIWCDAFEDCKKLVNITIPEGTKIIEDAFEGCDNLDIGQFDFEPEDPDDEYDEDEYDENEYDEDDY